MARGVELRALANLLGINLPEDDWNTLEDEVMKLLRATMALREIDVMGVEMATEFRVKGRMDVDE